MNGRTQESVNHALQHIRERVSDARANGIAADLGTAIGADAVVPQLPEVHILGNNLGIYEAMPFEKTDDAMWSLFEVNVLSGVRLSRHYLPLMKHKNWGRVVFISSESASQIPPEE